MTESDTAAKRPGGEVAVAKTPKSRASTSFTELERKRGRQLETIKRAQEMKAKLPAEGDDVMFEKAFSNARVILSGSYRDVIRPSSRAVCYAGLVAREQLTPKLKVNVLLDAAIEFSLHTLAALDAMAKYTPEHQNTKD